MSKRGHVVEVVREVVLMRGAGYKVGAKEGEEEGEGRSCLGQNEADSGLEK